MNLVLTNKLNPNVYLSSDNLVIKKINKQRFNPTEVKIMQYLIHPLINNSIEIIDDPKYIYIIQNLGSSDYSNIIGKENKKKIIYQIGEGISFLHQNQIIHGDIKLSNILLFSGNKIKLNDFGLSTFGPRDYIPCTSTHRALEVWLEQDWDQRIDVWAYGCTIFELIYGRNLFIRQSDYQFINCLYDFLNKYHQTKYKLKGFYYKYNTCSEFEESEWKQVILECIKVNRKNIDSILEFMKNNMN